MTRIRLRTLFLLTALLPPPSRAQFPPAPGTGPGLPETIEAIDAARVTTRILYITAHPDDESAAALTYLARGLHADVALLSLTRGEGGQNALGPEQAPQLGLIRTQELLAATRGYGVKLYFTRAKDFGYSKTPEETEKIWGDAVLEDMVRVIREFRPNIVINGWGGVHTGHGHHQTSGLWTPQAVKLAADAKYLAEPSFPAWDNNGAGVQILDVERGTDNPKGYILPVDDVSPLYGKSYREIGLDAFVNHRTQGIASFLNSPFLRRPIGLIPEDGSKLDPASLAQPITKLLGENSGKTCKGHEEWCGQLKDADKKLLQARDAALKLDNATASKEVLQAQQDLAEILPADAISSYGVVGQENSTKLYTQLDRILAALEKAAGLVFEAEAERSEIVMRDPLKVTVTFHCRRGLECPFQGPPEVWMVGKQFAASTGDPEHGLQFSITLDAQPPQLSISQLLTPEPPSILVATLKEQIDPQHTVPLTVPVTHTFASSTNVSRIPVRLMPAYTVTVEPGQTVEVLNAQDKPFDIFLRVHSYFTKSSNIAVGLDAPDGFTSSAPAEVHFAGIGDQYAKLTVTPPAKLAAGNFTITAYAKRGDEKFASSLEPLPTMPTILWSEPAQTIVHAFDINVPANLRVGYISAEGEPIPDALRRLGISVEMLDANALTFGDLSKYTSIVVGVRAYELRPELASANKRLLDYVSNGGTLVVQYNRDFIWNKFLPAPYHATIGNPTPRITDENAEVKFLKPDDSLLNTPNKITPADFQNWVQERGLYYWSDFDSKYTPLLSMHDPGEQDLNGGLVYTRLGKGVYIYTGLAFFRELPEGVPGAYRLFVNLLSAAQSVR
ncbi:MAG TPA: PIG-L family deacetylase [Candidatus Acidoferrum sp.]|nr:PIG-L family deacetylase [Candidatus Acidoferrum sp.]